MNLAQIRDLFIKRSGRYDLINEDGTDAGANFFIQSGSRFLDRRSNVDSTQSGAAVCEALSDGYIQLPECWLIKEVLVATPDGWRPLRKVHSARSFVCHRHLTYPTFYVSKVQRYYPDSDTLPAALQNAPASAFDCQDAATNMMTLEVFPHPYKSATIQVIGNFYSSPLIEDHDTNVWTDNFPDTLVKAALYQLEIFYRNTEGANDWLTSIQLDLTDAEQMEVLADIHGKDVMGL